MHTYVNRLAEGQGRPRCSPCGHATTGDISGPDRASGVLGLLPGRRGGSLRRRTRIKLCPGASHRRHIRRAHPWADLKELLPYTDGSALVGVVGYAINSAIGAYPEYADAIRSKLTLRGQDMLASVARLCVGQTLIDFAFRHLQPYFDEGRVAKPSTRSRSAVCWICRSSGAIKPNAPVLIDSKPLRPTRALDGGQPASAGTGVRRAQTSNFVPTKKPPFLNKLVVNHALPMLVDGEPAMQWIAGRFKRPTQYTELRRILTPHAGGRSIGLPGGQGPDLDGHPNHCRPPPSARLARRGRAATSSLDEVQRRIMGIETEFGVTCHVPRPSPAEPRRGLPAIFFRRVVSWGRSSNVFLRNGARLYLDVGSHPEYAHRRVRQTSLSWSPTTAPASGCSRTC